MEKGKYHTNPLFNINSHLFKSKFNRKVFIKENILSNYEISFERETLEVKDKIDYTATNPNSKLREITKSFYIKKLIREKILSMPDSENLESNDINYLIDNLKAEKDDIERQLRTLNSLLDIITDPKFLENESLVKYLIENLISRNNESVTVESTEPKNEVKNNNLNLLKREFKKKI